MHAPVRAPVLTIPVAGRFWAASGCRRLGTRRAPFSSESATPLSSAVDRSAECDFVSLPRTKKARYTVCSASEYRICAIYTLCFTSIPSWLIGYAQDERTLHYPSSRIVRGLQLETSIRFARRTSIGKPSKGSRCDARTACCAAKRSRDTSSSSCLLVQAICKLPCSDCHRPAGTT